MSKSIAIITGVSSGLGLELALGLVSNERTIIGISRGIPTDMRIIEEIERGRIVHVKGDVSKEDTLISSFDKANQFGKIDLLINCAGVGLFGPIDSFDRVDIDNVLRGNLIGTILFSEMAFKFFKQTNTKGSIINVMSTAAHVGRINEAIYCASKWGAKGYTESLRLEAKGTQTRIIAVYPGGMNTQFWINAKGSNIDSSKFMDPKVVANIIIRNLKRDDAAYVSDLTINRI